MLLDFVGGRIIITAQVKDRRRDPLMVMAEVATQGRSPATVNLARVGGNNFAGEFLVPANNNTNGQPALYNVVILATDGEVAPDRPATKFAGQVRVNGAQGAPPPPPPRF